VGFNSPGEHVSEKFVPWTWSFLETCFRVSDFGFRVSGFVFRVSGLEFWVSGFGCRVSGVGLRVDTGETGPQETLKNSPSQS
jgi:hypothetical protein